MMYLAVCTTALLASLATFFTGFGLGTLLLPVFVLFFPAELAVGLTAAVHLINGLAKTALVGRHADLRVALRLGVPAIAAALLGAWLLLQLSAHVSALKLVLAAAMLVFAGLELTQVLERVTIPPKWLPLGGVLSGFFGGLTGHQGALRSAFLLHAGLDKQQLVATGAVIALAVDCTRLAVYSGRLASVSVSEHGPLLLAAGASAAAGAVVGSRLLTKVTLKGIQRATAVLLILIALGVGSGRL